MSIFIRSEDSRRDSDIVINDSFTGFRLVDQYKLDDVTLVQELKEMRSVVKFGDTSVPTNEQILLYKNMMSLNKYNESVIGNIRTLIDYSYDRMNAIIKVDELPYSTIKNISLDMHDMFSDYINTYSNIVSTSIPASLDNIKNMLHLMGNDPTSTGNDLDWDDIWSKIYQYDNHVIDAFKNININGGVEIQQIPFVEYSLMNSSRFVSFISSFTQVHRALEPVIMSRLEGNNYLDCKLLATYGLPHSYSSDIDYDRDGVFWPDLNVQLEFDVKLFNSAMATNTINELRLIIKSYFNRLTSIHTPVDLISMDNNIYISHIIQQMESHNNVAYMKFIGWYTNEKGLPNGNYMDANTQAIVQKWKKLEDFPKQELERFVPEMFLLEDKNIVLNII
jgi:hypothetical protein